MKNIKPLKAKDKQIVIGLIKEPKDEIGEHDGFQVEPRYYKDFEQIVKNGWCYKYVEDDLIKGIIMAGNDGIRTTIYDIEVCKHSRRKGVGSKLLKYVVDKSIKEESGIISNFKFSVCNAKKLDGEKTIKELDLKDMDVILVR